MYIDFLHGNKWKIFLILVWPRYLIINIVINKIAPNGCADFNPETNKTEIKLIF